ncbi:hypothetical protein ACIBF5_27500 [Micromonospora sp. NPDC050417]|uniref:hypothetical protein n=1 Tax=Micromonospora sp. NPDC050417 TaxID=3364280 RepID=UPI0037ADC1EA
MRDPRRRLGKRQGWWGSAVSFSRVVPHGDGVGMIDDVGPGVGPSRIAQAHELAERSSGGGRIVLDIGSA